MTENTSDSGSESRPAGSGAPAWDRRRRTPKTPRRWARRVLIGLLAVLVLLILAATVLWLARREAARQLLVGWLEDRGVAADIQVETVEFDRFVGRIVIGDPANPDVRVERVEVDYVIGAPWSSVGLGVTPSRIRLVKPLVRASWREGRLSFGALDPIVEEFTRRPPDPSRRGPIVLVEQGEARLETEYGPVRALGDARLDDGRLMRLDARVPAASLKSGDIEGRLADSRLTVRTSDGPRERQVMAVALTTGLERFTTANSAGTDLALSLTGALPYPDRDILAAAQPVTAEIDLTAGSWRSPAGDFAGVDADLEISGRRGWIDSFRLDAETTGTVQADALEAGFAEGRTALLTLAGTTVAVSRGEQGVSWRGEGPVRLAAGRMALNDAVFSDLTVTSDAFLIGGRGAAWEATAPLALAADRFEFGDLNLRTVRGQLGFDLVNEGAATLSASGSMTAAVILPRLLVRLSDRSAMVRACPRRESTSPAGG